MKKSLRTVLDQLQTNIYITDVNTYEIIFMNDKMKKDYGIQDPEGQICWKLLQQGQEGPCSFCKINRLLNGEQSTIRWQEANSKVHRFFDNYDSLLELDEQKVHMQQSFDITEYIELYEQKEKDDLCDIWNRKKGKSMLEECLMTMKNSNHSYLVILFDVDDLKSVNEKYGYNEGDFMLKQTAETLKEYIREPDFLFRLSGDELVAVLQDVKEEDGINRIHRWRKELEERSKMFQKPYLITFSYGTSYVVPSCSLQVNDILAIADEKMFEEKLRKRKDSFLRENPSQFAPVQDRRMQYRAEFLYEALINSTDDFIYICDMKTGLFRYSPAQVELFGFPGEIVENPLPYWKEIIHPDDWERFYKSNMEIGENRADYHSVEFRARKRDGEYAWLRCRGQLIRDEEGEPCLFAGIIKLLGQQNKIDPLTQLLNHVEFTKQLEKNVKEDIVEQMAVMLLDIDDFHQINELYERSLGDQILKTLGQEIQSVLPDNARLYRLEKDCMGIIMEHGTKAQAEKLYFTIRENIMKLQEWKKQNISIELSAGCSMYPKDGKAAEELYKCALFTLQHVKKTGKNQILFYSENIMKTKSRTIELVRQLREDISGGYRGFYLNYQPQVDAETRKITGVEALMRWKDQEGRPVSPGEFIPVMEQNALIYDAGLWMVRNALHACKGWIRRMPEFTISVNISAVQLLEARFLDDFYKVIQEEGFPYENLIVELTESYAVKNMDFFWDKFRDLRSHGIRIAMDDFGTGYSSLEVLKTAPIDIVKIDRAFLEDILHSRFDATFISFVVAICHEVEIRVCQEGVETEDEYNFLKKMNLDRIQGYYFGKPVTEQEITALLDESLGEVMH